MYLLCICCGLAPYNLLIAALYPVVNFCDALLIPLIYRYKVPAGQKHRSLTWPTIHIHPGLRYLGTLVSHSNLHTYTEDIFGSPHLAAHKHWAAPRWGHQLHLSPFMTLVVLILNGFDSYTFITFQNNTIPTILKMKNVAHEIAPWVKVLARQRWKPYFDPPNYEKVDKNQPCLYTHDRTCKHP